MNTFNELFRKRVGIPQDEVITFDNLDRVLEKTAKTIPFENLCIIENRTQEITKENLARKILQHNEGGLCYELNTILYLFLNENGFNPSLVRGVTYNHMNHQWSGTGNTHVVNLITYNGQAYIVDTGFGGNLPLKPVPLSGETVVSSNGEFRVERAESEHGDYKLYMKLNRKDEDWKIGYAFNSKEPIQTISELNEVQKIIMEHPESAFNKKPLVTKITDKGNVTLTDTSFTQWVNSTLTKENIDEIRFHEIKKEYFKL
ncbi:arylamine N-acetyltransferase [Neobacillus niacini]|uniref:arylamine N-acetyltransferase family protein n=1 Tax=Neobacillus niacini TaxID=86668 RepID=UPI00052FD69A|nr:arylamine N-acetyltransferase [Neobacillus niacini]KGM45108.1 arylamine N-acetyltransferase [Neobacillus niacini]MEC1525329.1 arylamine N-acetyltransferase [Neobacillus niacini]